MQISKHIPKNIKTYKQEKNIEAQEKQCLGLSAVKTISFKSYKYTPQYIKESTGRDCLQIWNLTEKHKL